MSEIKKCVIVLGEGESEKICDRVAIHEYDSTVQKQDGEIVQQVLLVCNRHNEVFEEFMENQNE